VAEEAESSHVSKFVVEDVSEGSNQVSEAVHSVTNCAISENLWWLKLVKSKS
jgi:hypothetical protein